MSLKAGRHTLSIPGPSVMPERVLRAMHQGAPNIYEGALMETTAKVFSQLKTVARTDGDVAMYIANGHGAWEASLWNTLAPGETALVLATGRFGKGWAEMARRLGIQVELMDFGTAAPADPARVAERLRADKAHKIKAIMTVQTDTASSVRNDVAALGRVIGETGHPALFMVDCIASLACERFEMDAWGVDVMVAGCQKGLMVPPGTSFVFANDRAQKAQARLERVSPYFDWAPRMNPQMFYQRFGGTAPTHHLFGLDVALDMILEEEGLENVWRRHETLAGCVWAAVDAWSATSEIHPNINDLAHRSCAVTTIHTRPGDAPLLRRWCEEEANLTLGIGLGLDDASGLPPGESLFRIGHMGHLSPPMILGTLATVDAGLKSLGIAHGHGAMEAATAALTVIGTAAKAAE
ncbi:pyridoxal-phosphate-dependent aminotransferase family protein [Algicella marina]|uniref:Aminotransferase class V-fold PLP-dependent enzyme n=1 Tax=Algicella marina TaxID=2683284 RepID=A0A6P1T1J3_9RHOB|nr:aminotransferase class V-fold PLP-dependent enzyme [Algicella marina]QHQ35611.1 aminotransferase class V-fold PLP-dependent enzyme [Algicella marina]